MSDPISAIQLAKRVRYNLTIHVIRVTKSESAVAPANPDAVEGGLVHSAY